MAFEEIRWDLIPDGEYRLREADRAKVDWDNRMQVLRGILWGYALGFALFAGRGTTDFHVLFLLLVTCATYILVRHHELRLKQAERAAGASFSWGQALNPFPMLRWHARGWVGVYFFVFALGAALT